jgi:N-acetylneuraminic acid mutarotase
MKNNVMKKLLNPTFIFFALLLFVFVFYRCGTEIEDNPPVIPILSSPQNESTLTTSLVNFRWIDNIINSKYRIQISNSLEFDNIKIDETIAENSFTHEMNFGDGDYFWRVISQNNEGLWSKPSDVWKFEILTQGPNPPVLIEPQNNSTIYENKPTFKWSVIEEIENYNLQVSSDMNFGSIILDIESQGNYYRPSKNLANGEIYFRVRAKNKENLLGQFSKAFKININYAWDSKQNMSIAREMLASGVINNKIYVVGGYNGVILDINEEYDPITDSWMTKAPMSVARAGLATAVTNGKLYALGGFGDIENYAEFVNEEYNPVTNSWQRKALMPTGRSSFAAAAVDGKIYAIGGIDSAFFTNANEMYDPINNTWETKSNFGGYRYYISAAVVENKIYVIGGFGFHDEDNEMYDPTSDTWETKKSMITGRHNLSLAVVNNKIYSMGGGFFDREYINEQYNPTTDTWVNKKQMLTPRESATASVFNNKVYVIGGSNSTGRLSVNEEYNPENDK